MMRRAIVAAVLILAITPAIASATVVYTPDPPTISWDQGDGPFVIETYGGLTAETTFDLITATWVPVEQGSNGSVEWDLSAELLSPFPWVTFAAYSIEEPYTVDVWETVQNTYYSPPDPEPAPGGSAAIVPLVAFLSVAMFLDSLIGWLRR